MEDEEDDGPDEEEGERAGGLTAMAEGADGGDGPRDDGIKARQRGLALSQSHSGCASDARAACSRGGGFPPFLTRDAQRIYAPALSSHILLLPRLQTSRRAGV